MDVVEIHSPCPEGIGGGGRRREEEEKEREKRKTDIRMLLEKKEGRERKKG